MSEEAEQGYSSAKRGFAAFISYAHADAAAAAKLQAKLERYRLPKHIAVAHTGGTAALGKIFRDREDLAAAPSLSDAIRAAIAEAEALVVIASPEAKASRWVGEEIALFRALHPDRPILAALLRGEPDEAFPDALTEGGNEPLAADLRREGDGEALGFLKIVAGIAGVPLDALVQRDAQRRLRRVTWITGGALAAMLIMGVMTTLAIQARNEAARQRAEAEGLVEYMLTDLREKLRGVGRLDVMEGVNKRALTYYGEQSIKGRLLKAQRLHAMGEDLEKQGELDKAAAKFRVAHQTTAALLESDRDNADVVFAHTQSEYWKGFIYQRRAQWPEAAKQYKRCKALAERLVSIDPDRERAELELAHAKLNLGIAEMSGSSNNISARTLFLEAAAHYEKWLKGETPPRQTSYYLANSYAWIADAYYAEFDYLRALAYRQKELAIKEAILRTDPADANSIYTLTVTDLALAKLQMKLEQYPNAISTLKVGKKRADHIVAIDPENDDWFYQLFRMKSNLAIAQYRSGQTAQARRSLQEAQSMVLARRGSSSPIMAKMNEGIEATVRAIKP
jgi:tetratricopeptide (TPR) repeat protein